jgi:hypothetical protein
MAGIGAFLAKSKGYDPRLWFVIGLIGASFSGPLIMFIIIMLPSKNNAKHTKKTKSKFQSQSQSKNVSPAATKTKCVACGKLISIDTEKCKYCGEKFDIIDANVNE